MTLRAGTTEEKAFFQYARKRLDEAEKRIKRQTRSKDRIRAYMFTVLDSLADESFKLFRTPIWY